MKKKKKLTPSIEVLDVCNNFQHVECFFFMIISRKISFNSFEQNSIPHCTKHQTSQNRLSKKHTQTATTNTHTAAVSTTTTTTIPSHPRSKELIPSKKKSKESQPHTTTSVTFPSVSLNSLFSKLNPIGPIAQKYLPHPNQSLHHRSIKFPRAKELTYSSSSYKPTYSETSPS